VAVVVAVVVMPAVVVQVRLLVELLDQFQRHRWVLLLRRFTECRVLVLH
jgi:hypothetical protein